MRRPVSAPARVGGPLRPSAVLLLGLLLGLLIGLVLAPGVLAAGSPAPAASGLPVAGLSLSTDEGSPGQVIEARGLGWGDPADYGDVFLYASITDARNGATPLVVAELRETNAFAVDFPVPELEPGDYMFYACQPCSPARENFEARAGFRVTESTDEPSIAPTLSLLPGEQRPGGEVSATGTGWSTNAGPVQIFVSPDDAAVGDGAVAEGLVDDTASFITTFTVPELPDGVREFIACQGCAVGAVGTQVVAPLEILTPEDVVVDPTLSVFPDAGRVGDEITISGSDWSDDAGPVSLFADPALIRDAGEAFAEIQSTGGGFSVTLPMPELSEGNHTFAACQTCSLDSPPYDDVPFTVQAPVIEPSVVATLGLFPTAAEPGAAVDVTGARWDDARGPVFVFADVADAADPDRALLVVESLTDGGFEETLVVPAEASADLELYACQECTSTSDFPAARAELTLLAAPSAGSPWPPLLSAVLVVLVLLVLAALLQQRLSRRARRATSAPTPTLRPHVDASFTMAHRPSTDTELPTLRLVPHRDVSDPSHVEIR